MSKGKKKAVTLISLCAVMVLAICIYLFIPEGGSEDSEENGTTGTTVNVVSIDTEKISSIQIAGEEREEISLTKDGDAWKLTDLPDADITTETVEGMFAYLDPVTATNELGEMEFSEYGLDKPQMVVKITTTEGGEYELKFGDTVPATGGVYGLYGDTNTIYTFAESLYGSFDLEKNSLIGKEEITDINGDYLTLISVHRDGEESFRAEIVPDDKKVDAYTNWVISRPYRKPLAGSLTNDWTTLQGFFTSVTFDDLVEYRCKNWKSYGLENPKSFVEVSYFDLKDGYELPEETASSDGVSKIGENTNQANTVPDKYKDKKSYNLFFGKKNEDGDYYVRLDGSDSVYTMAAADVENMLGVDAYTYMDHSVYATLATDINGYDVTIGKKKISVTHDTEQDEDGKDRNVWTLNGENVPDSKEEEFLTPYSRTYLLEFTSSAKNDVKPDSSKPVMTIVYHEKDRDVTVKYLPYDGTNFYRVDKDGMDYFLVDKRSVDAVVSAFESLLDLDLSE